MLGFDQVIESRMLNTKTGEPLCKCSICEVLLSPYDYFIIAKAFSNGRLMMEAVQCFACQMASKEYASEQSIENAMLYSGRRFNEYIQDSIKRKMYHLEEPNCLITGEGLTRQDDFELYTFNIPGAGLEEDNFVFLGPTAMEQMSELLSKETRESWERYIEHLAPDSPELVVSPMFI